MELSKGERVSVGAEVVQHAGTEVELAVSTGNVRTRFWAGASDVVRGDAHSMPLVLQQRLRQYVQRFRQLTPAEQEAELQAQLERLGARENVKLSA